MTLRAKMTMPDLQRYHSNLLSDDKVPVQTADSTNVGPTNVGRYKPRIVQTSDQTNVGLVQTSDWYKCRTVQTSNQYKRQTSTNDLPNKNLPKGTEFLPLTRIFLSLYICNLVMLLTFDTFKLKLFDLIYIIGWNIKGYTTSGSKDIGILNHYSLWQLNSIPFWSVVLYTIHRQCYFQSIRLCSVVSFSL